MTKVMIYHNPECSKLWKTLALLEGHGIQPTIIDYLPPEQILEIL